MPPVTSAITNFNISKKGRIIVRGVNLMSQVKDELEEEYERFADHSVWDRTEVLTEDDTRYFIAWLRSTQGVEEVIPILKRLCSNLKCFFRAASDIQTEGVGKMGKLEAWLEAKICIGTGGRGRTGCFAIRLDPGSMQGDLVSASIISPEGHEVGACVFEI